MFGKQRAWGGERVLTSLFLAVSPRTAGFNTLPLTSLRGSTIAITILLMFIGGSSGSTAGRNQDDDVRDADLVHVFARQA